MPGNLLVRFDEGRVGRTPVSPSLLLYASNWLLTEAGCSRTYRGC
jgi:hypothetical protein